MDGSMGVRFQDTGIGREKEEGWEGVRSGKEGPDDSLGKKKQSLSWERHFHKYPWKQKIRKAERAALRVPKQKEYC